LTKTITVTATYLHSFGVHQMATIDSNAYLPGDYIYNSGGAPPTILAPRPNPNLGIVKEFYPEAVFKQDQLIVNVNAKLKPNFSIMGFYNFTTAHSDAGTASNSYNLSQDYGRASFASRNMLFLMANYQGPWGVRFNPFLIAQSGKPFNIVTNNDLSGDNFFNNRPSLADASNCTSASNATTLQYAQTSFGCLNTEPTSSDTLIPINLANGPAAVALNLRISRTWGIGPKLASTINQDSGGPPGGPGGPPPGGGGGRGGGPGGPGGGPGGGFGPGGFGGGGGGGRGGPGGMFNSNSTRKYNLTFSANAENLFNDIDYGTPSGTVIPTLTSGSTVVGPGGRFGKSTSLAGGPFSSGSAARRIFLQAVFSF
jgi:hypothetical protein